MGKTYCPLCLSGAIQKAKDSESPPQFRTPWPPPAPKYGDRRRYPRKDTSVPAELWVYADGGGRYDFGKAILTNVSLSGALLRALIFAHQSLPAQPHTIGIRLLEGRAKDLEILGRPVRLARTPGGGLEVAIEFLRVEEAQLRELRKIV
jgi:hypothetical protein